MSLPPLELTTPRIASTALAGLALGLALCPFAYILIGALSGFSPAFTFIFVPPLLLSTGYLMYRLLAAPRAGPSGVGAKWAEGVAWLMNVAFIVLVSGFTLLTTFERLGFACVLFLATAVVCLPLVRLRRTELRQRMQALPDAPAMALLGVIVVATGAMAVAYGLHKPSFI